MNYSYIIYSKILHEINILNSMYAMINGSMTMSSEFGRMTAEAVVTYIMVLLPLLHLYEKNITEKWQNIVDILHITHVSGVIELQVSHHSTTQNAYTLGLRASQKKWQ